MTPEQLAVRQRLYDDFAYYAENALWIRTKKGAIEPLKLNEAQRRLVEVIDRQLATQGYVRIVVLKGRQMGLSTAIGAWLFWWVTQRKAQRAFVLAHETKASVNLFDMTKQYYDRCPAILKPSTKYNSRKELTFDKLQSSYRVDTAGGDGIGRSEMITVAHLSELAFWPKSSAQANFSGLMDTIPLEKGTAVFIESTAQGVSGLFYDQYQAAARGEGAFEAVFLPWFIEPGYRAKVPKGFERTPTEELLVEKFGLDDEQLMFRRIRIAEKGADLFRQEYPNTAEEAFLTSGRPVFNPDVVAEMLAEARDPIARKSLAGVVDEQDRRALTFENNPRGELACYLPHDPNETYYIGADPGGGVRKDFSVAQVFDSKRRQAAVWRSDRLLPDAFGTVLANLGRYYNEAQIICERNNHGILPCRVLHVDEEYPWLYQETVYDKVTDTETTHIGFLTTEKSKPLVIDKLRAHVTATEIEIYDRDTLNEMRAFIVNERGKMEAEKGCHDDCVMALALADHINEGTFELVESTDEFYVNFEE